MKRLSDGTPIEVRDWGFFTNSRVMRIGDEAIIQDEVTCNLHQVMLLRGADRKLYLVDVRQLRRWRKAMK